MGYQGIFINIYINIYINIFRGNNMEIWKTIKSSPNYEVSNVGSIRNTKTGNILKVSTNNYGYKLVCLSNKNKKQTGYIHRLIAETFINTNLDTRTSVVNHIDGDKANNTINNLEWATYSDNAFHGRVRLKIKAEQATDLLDLLEQMDLDQIDDVVKYCKSILP
jgi:hypothetical protein